MPDDLDPAAIAKALRDPMWRERQAEDEAMGIKTKLSNMSNPPKPIPPPPPSDPYSTSMRGRVSDWMSKWLGPKTPDPTDPTPPNQP